MLYVNHFSFLNALGNTPEEILQHWEENTSPGMKPAYGVLGKENQPLYGHVCAELPAVPAEYSPEHASRNNQLLLAALKDKESIWKRFLANTRADRIGVILGTSTSGSEEAAGYIASVLSEASENNLQPFSSYSQEMGDPARFLAQYLNIKGPAYTICTACTSSARAIMSGARLIEAGVIDAAIVGGADSFARMPLNGFDALGVLSSELTQPLSADRSGITIGEAVGLMWLSKEPISPDVFSGVKSRPITLLGAGESSDAYHMSSPEPHGKGAEGAIRRALSNANLTPDEIDYLNLHGTGTPQNDTAECEAVYRVFGDKVLVSSTKPLTGHTLGAAGITDALLAILTLCSPVTLPAQLRDSTKIDPQLATVNWVKKATRVAPKRVMSNNFAFGGNNTSLIFGSIQD